MAEIIPNEQIVDAHKLNADGEVYLYEISLIAGGTVRIKADDTIDWRGNTYEGLPMQWQAGKKDTQAGSLRPSLVIGDQNVNLIALKPFLFDGALDGAGVVRHTILVDDLINNRLLVTSERFRVKHIPEYSRSQIRLDLATLGDSLNFAMPFRQYHSPASPSVSL